MYSTCLCGSSDVSAQLHGVGVEDGGEDDTRRPGHCPGQLGDPRRHHREARAQNVLKTCGLGLYRGL